MQWISRGAAVTLGALLVIAAAALLVVWIISNGPQTVTVFPSVPADCQHAIDLPGC